MKKVLFLVAMVIGVFQFAMAIDVVTTDVNKLPAMAREMISRDFPNSRVASIKIDKDLFEAASYEVKLENGTEVEFNANGEWVEIDCKNNPVPAFFIPQGIARYMNDNYNGHKIVKIERDRKGYELTLHNGWEVEFDRYDKFVKVSE